MAQKIERVQFNVMRERRGIGWREEERERERDGGRVDEAIMHLNWCLQGKVDKMAEEIASTISSTELGVTLTKEDFFVDVSNVT